MPMHDWTRIDANDYHAFHVVWIGALQSALNNGVLPKGYYALAEHVAPPVIPDVLTLQFPTTGNGAGGTATAPTQPRIQFTAVSSGSTRKQAPRRRIAVRDARGRQLVAVIEIISPSNKASRREFNDLLDKAVLLLQQGIHLFVVDPFPPTARDPHGIHAAMWKALVKKKFTPPPGKPLTLASYTALGANKYATLVEPIAVGDVLPDMPLFLTPDVYVNVPLEPTYQAAWQGFPEPLRDVVEGGT